MECKNSSEFLEKRQRNQHMDTQLWIATMRVIFREHIPSGCLSLVYTKALSVKRGLREQYDCRSSLSDVCCDGCRCGGGSGGSGGVVVDVVAGKW